jgi:NitT/TauT family transport system ATP-binding protein
MIRHDTACHCKSMGFWSQTLMETQSSVLVEMSRRPPVDEEKAISVHALSKRFRVADGAVTALDKVSLDVRPGEFVAIVGPSGCGKSTLLRLVAGLIAPSAGTITLQGQAVTRPQTALGIVFQSPVLLEWRTILDNVLLQLELRDIDPRLHRERATTLLASVGLAEFADRYPRELSGGMRQRAAIVRALIHDPPLLLMDEPFGALDALTREQMRIDLESLWLATRKTVVFITHSIDEAVLLADRVVVMSARPGRIEQVLPVDLPRPRGLDGRKAPAFVAMADHITSIFLARGVLHGAAAPPPKGSP